MIEMEEYEMPVIPRSARVVIVGGGVSGCSVAYHLAELGWTDIVLLERKQLTSGTTWHAAGLIGQLRSTQNMTRLAKYSADLYPKLTEETGIETGFRQCGSISVALTHERNEELLRQAGAARAFGIEVNQLSPADVKALYPHLETSDIVGGVHLPHDGQADPGNIALALAKGARMRGVQIFEDVKLTQVITRTGRVHGVRYEAQGHHGEIKTNIVVNCAGLWGRNLAAENNISLPLHACEHFYIITENIPGLEQLPVLRVPDEQAYYKEDAGKLLMGGFELKAKPWGVNGIPEEFCFDQLPEDFEHFEPILEMASKRVPLLGKVGIHTFFNGPESFTPDGRYYLGEAREVKGYWVAAGYNSVGIGSSGGAGIALAQWMNDGHPPFDLWDVDIRRSQPFQRNRRYLQERVTETLGIVYANNFPYRQMASARGVRRSPMHEHLKTRGAVFGEVAGWERANWFANSGQRPEYVYTWKKQVWFDNQRAEHMAVREQVGLMDLSSFGKIRVEGPAATPFLQRLCANDIDIAPGRIAYSQMLNDRGGIECDLTVTRLSETAYLLVVPGETLLRDFTWLERQRADMSVVITDVSAAEAVIPVMGPRSRELLSLVSPDDLSNEAFPFGTMREIEIGLGVARAHRISYVGELGWELYVSSDQAAHVFETLVEAGEQVGLRLCGLHAVDSCRIEKAYRHFGHDITDEDHVLEAGLGFAVKIDKGDFIGRDAVLRKRDEGLARRLLQFRLKDPEAQLYRNELILRDGELVGYLTSGAYGHALGAAVGLGYVPCHGESVEQLLASKYAIGIAGEIFEAEASLTPMYDPKARRTRM